MLRKWLAHFRARFGGTVMKPARLPRSEFDFQRLLHIDSASHSFSDKRLSQLPGLLEPGDLLVLNDAATLPASLPVPGRDLEVRLAGRTGSDSDYRAVLFGAGDHRTPTEARPLPERLEPGDELCFGADLSARIVSVDPKQPRLVELCFTNTGDELWRALYRYGRPIQYSYLDQALELWDVQSRFAGRPWAVEPPSAGRPLTWQTLFELRLRGVAVTSLTHAAGLSSTGSAELDARLPFPERYAISNVAARAVSDAIAGGGRVVAVGTTVVRALESAVLVDGTLRAGEGVATLVVRPGFRPKLVRALLTGMHEPGSSHFDLMCAFADRELLTRALEHATRTGYLAHEFGDSCLLG
jgi:S-adenosylmethionine:tRNA ribosyltransferase-isomerase